MTIFLVTDIGGTDSRFACFQQKGNNILFKISTTIKTNDFSSFEELLNTLKTNGDLFDVHQHSKFVLAIPGPVTPADELAFPAVTKWTISKSSLKKLYPDTEISFINDFTAQAYGCLTEAANDDALPLIKIEQERDDIAIVGAGTGLGHGTLKKTAQGGYLHLPSESGQIPFPFINDEFEQQYRSFIVQQTGITHPVGDDVVSGEGLAMLHKFITGKILSPSAVAAELDAASETTQWFAKFYARDCRNYVLTTLAGGGKLFISGGVAIKNPFLVDNDSFRNEFSQGSETAKNVLAHISVSLIQDERIGLFGAAYYAAHIAVAD